MNILQVMLYRSYYLQLVMHVMIYINEQEKFVRFRTLLVWKSWIYFKVIHYETVYTEITQTTHTPSYWNYALPYRNRMNHARKINNYPWIFPSIYFLLWLSVWRCKKICDILQWNFKNILKDTINNIICHCLFGTDGIFLFSSFYSTFLLLIIFMWKI